MSEAIDESFAEAKARGLSGRGRARPLDRASTVWLLVAAWAAGMTYLSSLSGDSAALPALGSLHIDKVMHFLAYAVGGGLLARAFRLSFCLGFFPTLALVVLALALFGWLDEYHQTFVGGRSGGDLGDWAADVLGAAAGALVSLRGGKKQAGAKRNFCAGFPAPGREPSHE